MWVGTNYFTISTGACRICQSTSKQARSAIVQCTALTPAFPVHFLIENTDGENMSDIWIARLSKQELRGTHEQAEEGVNNITLYVPPSHTTNICQSSDRHKFRDKIFNDFEIVLSKRKRMSLGICNDNMRQCQIRVRFESRGSQFFKTLGKCFLMTQYTANIIIWCIERGFLQKNHLITCFRRFYQHPNHLAVYIPLLGQEN